METRNILVIDDDKFVRGALIRELSQDPSYIIDSASSGEEAVHKVKDKKYDLFFIDLMMPEMDGVETCKAIRQISPGSQFICFTGVFDQMLSARGSDYIDAGGRTRLLYKPFREKSFLETAREVLL